MVKFIRISFLNCFFHISKKIVRPVLVCSVRRSQHSSYVKWELQLSQNHGEWSELWLSLPFGPQAEPEVEYLLLSICMIVTPLSKGFLVFAVVIHFHLYLGSYYNMYV